MVHWILVPSLSKIPWFSAFLLINQGFNNTPSFQSDGHKYLNRKSRPCPYFLIVLILSRRLNHEIKISQSCGSLPPEGVFPFNMVHRTLSRELWMAPNPFKLFFKNGDVARFFTRWRQTWSRKEVCNLIIHTALLGNYFSVPSFCFCPQTL